MIVDRLEALTLINFLEQAIPTDEKTGKNCVFVRVDGDKLIFIAGGEFVIKKGVLNIDPITENEAKKANGETLPERFMIPLAAVLSFKALIKAHKVDCKKLTEDDEKRLFVEIDDKKLFSEETVYFDQPKFQYKDLETLFDVTKSAVGEMPVMPADLLTIMSGFQKSKPVEVSFTGHKQPVHFCQGDLEAILIPPVEKPEGDENEQKTIDE